MIDYLRRKHIVPEYRKIQKHILDVKILKIGIPELRTVGFENMMIFGFVHVENSHKSRHDTEQVVN